MAGAIKFYLDEHCANAIAEGLRRRGVDAQTTYEAGLSGATDDEQLSYATGEVRVILTRDPDFLRLHAAGARHSGIVFAHQGMLLGDIIRGMMLIYEVLEASEMLDHVEYL